MQYLRLRDNNLSGDFPDSIDDLENLVHMDLSNNQITGWITWRICDLKWEWFNIDNNWICNNPSCLDGLMGYQFQENCFWWDEEEDEDEKDE